MDRRAGRRDRGRLIAAGAFALALSAACAGTDDGSGAGTDDGGGGGRAGATGTAVSAVDIAHHPDGHWVLWDDGSVVPDGGAPSFRAATGTAGRPVALAPTPSGDGYWVFTDRGEVVGRGDAPALGDVDELTLVGAVDDGSATADGRGYYQLGADGGVFAHGDAAFHGSVPGVLPAGVRPSAPVVAVAPTASGAGYHLAGADGGVFTFGDATFHGSVPGVLPEGTTLAAPIVDLVPRPDGYLLLGADGGVFAFGSSAFHGSLGGQGITDVVAATARPDGSGYLLLRADGTVHAFGSATGGGPGEPTGPTTGPEAADPPVDDPAVVPVRLRPTVLARHPHDTGSFTQGLEMVDGRLVESAGMYGESDLRVVDVATGVPTAVVPVDPAAFAEGVTEVDGTLVQLTWREGVAYRYRADTLEPIGTFTYDGEGWGICDDGDRLVMSDGSSRLTFRGRDDFAVVGTVDVTLSGRPVERLNELECVGDDVYANVWRSNDIVRIDPATGAVEAVVDASALAAEAGADAESVLNGIAHRSGGRFFVTGKYWPTLYEVRFDPA